MEFVPLLVMSAMVKKIVDFAKYATNMDVNALITQVVAWAAGVGVAFVAASSDFAQSFQVNGIGLGELNGWSLALFGFTLSSAAGVGWDTIKAVDNNNSAAVPPLVPGAPTNTDGV